MDNQEKKQRHVVVTVWLWLIIVASLLSAIINVIYMHWGYGAYVEIVAACMAVVNAVSAITILCWRKIGYWLFVASSIIVFSTMCSLALAIQGLPSYVLMFMLGAMVSPAVLYGILCIKKNGVSCWNQLEPGNASSIKCNKCGAELDDDSRYCEACGTKLKHCNKTKWWVLAVAIAIGALQVLIMPGCCSKTVEYAADVLDSLDGYTDLGLPSGKLWKSSNEDGFYTYAEAVNQFGDNLPTKEDCEELDAECQWNWMGDGYKVTGPNGNSITFPAAGRRDCDEVEDNVGSMGYYWSATPSGLDISWILYFESNGVVVGGHGRCDGLSVRLVQDK